VSDGDSDQVTVLDAGGGSARHAAVGYSPDAVAVSGSQARTRQADAPITVGDFPVAVAITG
jgi:hypothetical protein